MGKREISLTLSAAIQLAALLASPSWAFGQENDTFLHQYEGNMGTSRIGMTVIRQGNQIKGGHYFYQKFLKNISVTGSIEGSQITLEELGQGTFHLHFVGNGSEGSRPLDFENSIGMDGTWMSVDGARIYPVSLRGTTIRNGAEAGHLYSEVTNETDEAFEKRVQSFFRAVLRGDKATATRFISYPLRANFADGTRKKFRNSPEVLAIWNDLFNPAMMTRLQRALPHEMFVHEGQAMLGNGEAWFDAKGLAVLNVPAASDPQVR